MSLYVLLIEAVEAEGFGGGGVVAAAFGDVHVVGVLDGGGDGGADGGQVDRPAAGAWWRCLRRRSRRGRGGVPRSTSARGRGGPGLASVAWALVRLVTA